MSDDEFWRLNERIRALKDDLRTTAAENERLRTVVETARQASNDLERLKAQQMVIAYPVSVRALRDGLAAFDQQEAT